MFFLSLLNANMDFVWAGVRFWSVLLPHFPQCHSGQGHWSRNLRFKFLVIFSKDLPAYILNIWMYWYIEWYCIGVHLFFFSSINSTISDLEVIDMNLGWTITNTYANGIDPAEITLNKPSHQDLYCLLFLPISLYETMDVFKFRGGKTQGLKV